LVAPIREKSFLVLALVIMSWLTCFAVFQGFPLQWKNKNNKWDMTLHQNDNRCFIKEKWKDIQYRQGNWQDFSVIFSALWREKMNITGAFSPQYFVIAYLPKDELDVLLGFGQVCEKLVVRTWKLLFVCRSNLSMREQENWLLYTYILSIGIAELVQQLLVNYCPGKVVYVVMRRERTCFMLE
jgi:hypothetical protein